MPDPVVPDEPADADLITVFRLGRYRKMITALVLGLTGWGVTVVTSDPGALTAGEWVGLGTVLAVTAGVYAVPNKP